MPPSPSRSAGAPPQRDRSKQPAQARARGVGVELSGGEDDAAQAQIRNRMPIRMTAPAIPNASAVTLVRRRSPCLASVRLSSSGITNPFPAAVVERGGPTAVPPLAG